MSTTSIRWVSVDDTSTDFRYIGDSWFADKGSLDLIGHNGPPFLSTLHGTNSSASFAFNFTGQGLRVMGTYTGTQNSSTLDWTCFVDGVNRYKGSPNGDFNNNQLIFCTLPILTDGHHTVTVNASVGVNQTFWLDKIQYLPSASVSLENKTVQLDRTDSAITYGYGWSTTSYQTQTNGSQFGCNFYGVSVIWYGTETSGNSTTGTWTIDDNPPTTFAVNGLGTSNTPVNNVKYFETPQYSMGSHRLIVTYNGDNSTTPLGFAYLVVQNGTLPRLTGSTNSTSATSSTGSSSQAGTTPSINTGAIIGGVLGGGACLLIAILIFFFRRDSKKDKTRKAEVDSSFIHVPAQQSSSGTVVSALPSYPTQGQPPNGVFLPTRHTPGVSPRPQDGQLMGNMVEQFVAIPHEPSRREHHLPQPRKLQMATRNLAAEGFASSGDEQQHPLKPLDAHGFGGPIDPSGFVVHQDSGVQPISQQALMGAPPAYS